MRKITFGTEEEKATALAEAKANQTASEAKHAAWIEAVESAEVVPE